jgi:predicted transcriptional regulator
MRDIADEWGVSTACVAQYLKRLKAAWRAHFDVAINNVIDRRIG